MRASVAIIVLLVGLAMALYAALNRIDDAASPSRTSSSSREGELASSAAPGGSRPTIEDEDTPAFTWSSIESEDLDELVANLRGIGCPEATLRDIALIRVDALFAAREDLCRFRAHDAHEPWGSQAPLNVEELEQVKRWRALQTEKRELLRDLLGLEMPLDLLRATHTRNYDDFVEAMAALPQDKRDRVQALKESYWQASDVLKENFRNGTREEYGEAYRRLNEIHREELARVLTPRELEDFDMRTSVTGRNLAVKLAEFRPSEREFRAIFRSAREYEEASGRVGGQYGLADVDDDARKSARVEMLDALRSVLGEERFAEYEHSGEPAYQDLIRAAERHGLPRRTALQAYGPERAYEEERRRLEREGVLRHPELLGRLEDLKNEVEATLGVEAARTYRWLRSRTSPPSGRR